MLLAHSADPKKKIAAQDYADHVNGVVLKAVKAAQQAAQYAACDGNLLRNMVSVAGEFHDLGKLDHDNQAVLSGKIQARKLPVQHADAGTAYLLDELEQPVGAVLVYSHHIGLPDFSEEQNRSEDTVLRDETVAEKVNNILSDLVTAHRQTLKNLDKRNLSFDTQENNIAGDVSLFYRIALSCLVDGDHTDTAIHYQNYPEEKQLLPLYPEKRLKVLDNYVESLKSDDARSQQRSQVYESCRNAKISENIVSCDSPVGTGKTTAVMAHLLTQATQRNLRRIFVILPFTNIITQSVEVYRKALVLPGENPEDIVAELHHRADFQDKSTRQYSALWHAPIIVTTAVSFFETLASNAPAALRKLHNLPGSAIFIDEAHAALPAKLLPLAWRWIKLFAAQWSCYWVLASGSLNRFWKIDEFDKEHPEIPEIMSGTMHSRLMQQEHKRIIYQFKQEPVGVEELIKWTSSLSGPRIVIVNTVQSAAVLAHAYAKHSGRETVEHLSTALIPSDRDKTIARIKSRLKSQKDSNWTLIATSCVEAGVDFSFKTGFREAASLVSLLQTAGRVNRNDYESAETVWTFLLKDEDLLKRHPGMKDSSKVLLDLIAQGKQVSPELCTYALQREIRLAGKFSNDLLSHEEHLRFPEVEKMFKVINADTRTVLIDEKLIQKIENRIFVDWKEIQKGSVQIWGYRIKELDIPEIPGYPGLYKWTHNYNNFIGYMAGLLFIESFRSGQEEATII